MAYRFRFVLMGQQPVVIGIPGDGPTVPSQTIEGHWSKPTTLTLNGRKNLITLGPTIGLGYPTIALSGRKSAIALSGRKVGSVELTGVLT